MRQLQKPILNPKYSNSMTKELYRVTTPELDEYRNTDTEAHALAEQLRERGMFPISVYRLTEEDGHDPTDPPDEELIWIIIDTTDDCLM